MLTLSKAVKGHQKTWQINYGRPGWSKLKKVKPIAVSGAFETV